MKGGTVSVYRASLKGTPLDQNGIVGQPLDRLSVQLTVGPHPGEGLPYGGQKVEFVAIKGLGRFIYTDDPTACKFYRTTTDRSGRAHAVFQPGAAGEVVIECRWLGDYKNVIVFTTTVTAAKAE